MTVGDLYYHAVFKGQQLGSFEQKSFDFYYKIETISNYKKKTFTNLVTCLCTYLFCGICPGEACDHW